MKRGMFTLTLATSLFSISCTKDDAELPAPPETAAASAVTVSYVSGWEAAPAWQVATLNGTTVFSFKRPTPQLTRQQALAGAVVVWTKGYDFEGVVKSDKPLGMPFTWIPADERYMHPYKWYYESKESSIGVGVEMHSTMAPVFSSSSDNIRMRYFVLSDDFMKAHRLDGPALRKLSYSQLVEMMNVAP